METTRTYICSREKFLELKGRQKEIAYMRKNEFKLYYNFNEARRSFYMSKNMEVPGPLVIDTKAHRYVKSDELYGFERKMESIPSPMEARCFNIIYGIVKGKTYKQIEPKVRETNEFLRSYHRCYELEKYCDKYGVDYNTIKEKIYVGYN